MGGRSFVDPEMPKFELENLEGWRKSACIWGAIGLVGSAIARNSLTYMFVAVLLGAATGALSGICLSKGKSKWVNYVNLTGIAVLVFLLWQQPALRSLLGSFSLGALFVSLKSTAYGHISERYLASLNRKYKNVLEVFAAKPKRLGLPETPTSHDEIRDAYLQALPEDLRREFKSTLTTITTLHPIRSVSTLPPTHSSLGGAPLLPPSQPWPVRNGQPLEFLAQIDLSQLPPTSRPCTATGLLAFFYDATEQPWGSDAEDLSSAAIIHCPDPSICRQTLKPGTPPPPPLRLPVAFRQSPALAISESQEEAYYSHFRSLPEDEKEALNEIDEALLETNPGYNRIFSAPARIQGDMAPDLAVASSAYGLPEDTEWVHVLQLDSVDELGWCWGDAGCLYFYLPLEDFTNHRFERPWVVLQCH